MNTPMPIHNNHLDNCALRAGNKNTGYELYKYLGAHVCAEGTFFAVWAPHAAAVSVVGDFNDWNIASHKMKLIGDSGIWELFVPKIGNGELYKYAVTSQTHEVKLKADPYAFYAQKPPETASVIWNIGGYKWHDRTWMESRAKKNILKAPMSIYEVHLGSWKKKPDPLGSDGLRYMTYDELSEELVTYVSDMGYTHIELMPVAEFPFDGSWGYQTTGYYAATSRHGNPHGFMKFVDSCHSRGIGVIIDWVPAHFPKDAHGLGRFDGAALYEHSDPRRGEHPEWGTYIFDYGKQEVRNFLISNAVFWAEVYHVDGIRADAVSSMIYLDYSRKTGEWLPNKHGGRENLEAIEFLKELNETIGIRYPGFSMIAEESTAFPLVSRPVYMGGLGFMFKWNMGWMNDFLRYIQEDPLNRRYHHNCITFAMMYAYSENYILVLSHDEVVHGKASLIGKHPGEYDNKFAGLRASMGFMYSHPGKKLTFMGSEFGQFIEWDYRRSLDWFLLDYEKHAGMQRYIHDLNRLYTGNPCMYELDYDTYGFEWMNCDDNERSIVSFVRRSADGSGQELLFICNFTPVVYNEYRVPVTTDSEYIEIMNSDRKEYGGTDIKNSGIIKAKNIKCKERESSISVKVPPYGFLTFKKGKNIERKKTVKGRTGWKDV